MSKPTAEEIEHFNSKWAREGDCHIWMGYKDRNGYGQHAFRRAQRRAHRVALFLAGVDIPEGYVVNHICSHRACVNPQHLEAIPLNENWRKDSRAISYINSQKTHCKQGHPYDRKWKNVRYCSICQSEKRKRLRAKWKAEGIFRI